MNAFRKTHVTPELRTAIREQLQHLIYSPTSEHDVETAHIMTQLGRTLAAQYTDEELDKVLLQIHEDYDSQRIPF